LSYTRSAYAYFEKGKAIYANSKNLANWIKGELAYNIYQRGIDIDEVSSVVPVESLIDLLILVDKGTLSGAAGKTVLSEMVETKKTAGEIVKEKGLEQVSDESAITEIAKRIIEANPSAVENYASGKSGALMFLVGQVMKEMKGKGNPGMIKELLEHMLAQ